MSDPEPIPPGDLAAAYALGALAPDEARRFEEFLAGSPEARRELAEFREAAALLALDGSAPSPGPALRERVLARIRSEQHRDASARAPRHRSAGWPLALAASLIAAAGLALALVSSRSELRDLRALLAATQGALAAREATLNAIFEPGVRMYQLTASGNPDPGVQLFYDRQRGRAIIHGFRLKQVPADRAYQLWFIQDGKPVPSVTFTPEPDGHAKVERIPLPAGGEPSAAAITVEPESGSPQPTSPIVLVGNLEQSSR